MLEFFQYGGGGRVSVAEPNLAQPCFREELQEGKIL